MKKILLLLFIFPTMLFAQKIEENRKDEFKGTSIIGTSYETLIAKGSTWLSNQTTVKYRFVKINGTYGIQVKMVYNQGKVFSIDKDAELIFKFNDGTITTFNAVDYAVANEGGAATGAWGSALYGVFVSFLSVEDPNLDNILNKTLTGARIYTDEGYVEDVAIKDKVASVFNNSIKLIKTAQ